MPLSEPGFGPASFDGPLVITPAPTDRFVVRQADGVVRVETRAQIYTAEVGEQFLFPIDDDPITPSLAISATGTGFFGSGLNQIAVAVNAIERWEYVTQNFRGVTATGAPNLVNGPGTVGAPTYVYTNDINTGRFRAGVDIEAVAAGGVEVARFTEAAGVVQFIVASQNNIATPAFALGDGDSGILETADDVVVLASLSQNCMEYSGIGAVPLIAFYGAAAIALQTGVAVTSAGIHAALVNLNLITA